MVRGLTVGIYHNRSQIKPDIKVTDIPKKEENPKFIIDGQSLAFHILTPKDKDHSWEFANGGAYYDYQNKMTEFFEVLSTMNAESVIVFPLPEGTAPVSDSILAKWNQKTQEKLKRVTRVRQLLEKSGTTSRNLLDVLPPFMITEITDTAHKLKIPVIYTRNNVNRFCAKYVQEGEADAIIANNSDYMIFDNVKYIPINSFYHNEENELMCDFFTTEKVCEILQLNDPAKLVDLSVLLGNDFTESFVTSKFNVYTLLHIKPNPKYPANLVEGIVDFLNKDEYEGLDATTPFQEIVSENPEFKAAIEESKKHFDISGPLVEEGDSLVRKEVEKGKLPTWAVSVAENGDFWYVPVIDDYTSSVATTKVTEPIRKIIYGILGRKEVVEHIPVNEEIQTVTVQGEPDLPTMEQLHKMKGDKLEKVFYNIAHANFPKPPDHKKDPLAKLEEPVKTIGLALRYIVAQCFTDNQASYTKTPAENKEYKDAGIIGAPPIDYFELRALAAQALCLMLLKVDTFQAPDFKPKLRRIHVSGLYQEVVAHMLWLQQFFGQKSDKIKPHRVYDGQIFAAAYDAEGKIGSEKFAPFFEDPDAVAKLEEKRLEPFLKAVLFPFPADLFKTFESVPRSLNAAAFEEAKPAPSTIKAATSAFAALMDDEEDEGEPVQAPPAPVVAPPPPPPSAPAKKKEAKPVMDEDEEMAFLLAAAAQKKPSDKPRPEPKAAPPKKKNRGPAHRRVEKVNLNEVRNFNKESKLDAKLQTKQQGFDW